MTPAQTQFHTLTERQTRTDIDTGKEKNRQTKGHRQKNICLIFQNSTCLTSGPGLCPTNLSVNVEREKDNRGKVNIYFPLYIYGPRPSKRILVYVNLVFTSVGQVYLFNYCNRVNMANISNSKTTKLPYLATWDSSQGALGA